VYRICRGQECLFVECAEYVSDGIVYAVECTEYVRDMIIYAGECT